jgi:cell division protein ZapA
MEPSETFQIKVFGSEYSVRADADADHVARVAQVVDRKMKEIDQQFGSSTVARTAVLACMNLVDEHLKDGREGAERLGRRLGVLIEKLDNVL